MWLEEHPEDHIPDIEDVRESPDCQTALQKICEGVRRNASMIAIATNMDKVEEAFLRNYLEPGHIWTYIKDIMSDEYRIVTMIRSQWYQDLSGNIVVLPDELTWDKHKECRRIELLPEELSGVHLTKNEHMAVNEHAFAYKRTLLDRSHQRALNRNDYDRISLRRRQLTVLGELYRKQGYVKKS